MKGIISSIEKSQVKMKDGTMKEKFTIQFEGDSKSYEAWNCAAKVGEEAEGEVSEREWNGKIFYSIKFAGGFKGGGFQPRGKSPDEMKQQVRSFAASYSKDIVVALINQGRLPAEMDVDKSLQHYYLFFKALLEA